jgi:heme exporter protein B
VIFPVYALFFQLTYVGQLGGLLVVVFLASVGFMVLGTLFSAMTASSRLGETMLPVLLLPLLIPVVIYAAGSTQRLIIGRPFAEVSGSVRVLLAFDLVFLIVATLLFSSVVEE